MDLSDLNVILLYRKSHWSLNSHCYKSMSIVVGEDDYFDINAETGIVKTTKVLDFETASQTTFLLTLKVEDSANNADTAILTVNLINVNDNAPVFSSNMYHTSVRENMIEGTQTFDICQ